MSQSSEVESKNQTGEEARKQEASGGRGEGARKDRDAVAGMQSVHGRIKVSGQVSGRRNMRRLRLGQPSACRSQLRALLPWCVVLLGGKLAQPRLLQLRRGRGGGGAQAHEGLWPAHAHIQQGQQVGVSLGLPHKVIPAPMVNLRTSDGSQMIRDQDRW